MSRFYHKYIKYKSKYLELLNNNSPQRSLSTLEQDGSGHESSFQLLSRDFNLNEPIPRHLACDSGVGSNNIPELHWINVPFGTTSMALIMEDPDAPHGVWDHLVCWSINPIEAELDLRRVRVGVNSWGRNNYGAPCPPPGSGIHRYIFRLYALNRNLEFKDNNVNKVQLLKEINKNLIESVELIGLYSR